MTRKRSVARKPKEPAQTRPPASIYWTDRALSDLEAIGEYMSRDDPAAAEGWVMRLILVAEKAAIAPLAGRRVPELAREDVRDALLGTYRIVYRVTDERVEVLTVFEGHRLFPTDIAQPEDDS